MHCSAEDEGVGHSAVADTVAAAVTVAVVVALQLHIA